MGKYLVGIDEGTTGCKTCVFDFDGNILGTDYREYPCYYPHPGWVEQIPEDITPNLFDSCKQAIKNSGVDPKEIVAMGLSAQGSVIGMLDENGDLIRPFVGWQDVRGQQPEFDELLGKISLDEYYAITGDPLGSTFSTAKLIWLKNHEPENWAKTALFSTHEDYFLKQFGADGYYTDLSSASREGTADVDKNIWSERIHDILGIRADQRAQVVAEPGKIVGHINEEMSEKTGLPVGCNICMGAHDQNCCSFGGGVVDAGTAVMVVGTFGSCFVASDKPIRDPKKKLVVKGNHGVGNWTIEAFANAAASAFRWYRDTFGDLEKAAGAVCKEDPYNLITNQMVDVPVGSRGVTFLPFLQGAAGSRLNPQAKGTFLGMDLGTTKADMARAVLEGICFEMYDIVRAEEEAGIEVTAVRLTGGAAKSPLWCQMLADIMQKPVQLLQTSETGCLGAALYAGIGSGIFKDCREAVQRAVKLTKEFAPNPDNKAAYQEAFDRWCAAYDALNGRFY